MKLFKLTTDDESVDIEANNLDKAIEAAEERLSQSIDVTKWSSYYVIGFTRRIMQNVRIEEVKPNLS